MRGFKNKTIKANPDYTACLSHKWHWKFWAWATGGLLEVNWAINSSQRSLSEIGNENEEIKSNCLSKQIITQTRQSLVTLRPHIDTWKWKKTHNRSDWQLWHWKSKAGRTCKSILPNCVNFFLPLQQLSSSAPLQWQPFREMCFPLPPVPALPCWPSLYQCPWLPRCVIEPRSC